MFNEDPQLDILPSALEGKFPCRSRFDHFADCRSIASYESKTLTPRKLLDHHQIATMFCFRFLKASVVLSSIGKFVICQAHVQLFELAFKVGQERRSVKIENM